jgi:hypothetical protein
MPKAATAERHPEAEVIRALYDRVKTLERQVDQLQAQLPLSSVQISLNPPAGLPTATCS